MHLHKLMYQFKVLVEHETFTAASEYLCISQPTLTQNIKRLEQALDTSLLVRNGKVLKKTVFGDSLYKHACLLDKSYSQALDELEYIKNHQRKTLMIECGYGWSHGQLMLLLQDYTKLHPDIKIVINNSNSSDSQSKLIKGQCDIALGAIPTSDNRDKAIHYLPIYQTQFSLFCSRDHPFSQLTQISNRQLENSDWIVLRHSGEERENKDPFLFPFKPNSVRFEVHSVTSAISLLSVSQCVMALPEPLHDEAIRKGLVELNTVYKCPIYDTGIMYTDDALLLDHKKEMIESIVGSRK
ncbi:LysR family transcriptional regulator [Vibrio splendidus]|uniref:LysR family transcriptional regulator n=1 Tax=Vibrio splendidus TaxID=29497 RepID=A0ABD5A9I2_VIBSP|nr:LysR family transcriptional regulator [Vibrio splendidus]MDP2488986.1 LysR family transcriptional regulator [Vibrio splendidus]PMO54915.1 hypothetical protein BCT08_13300 [Vibrio splendidus]